MLERVGREQNLPILLIGIKIGTATVENSMKVIKKTKNRTTILPISPASGHITKRKHGPKVSMHPSIHCSTVYNSQDMEET